VFVPLTHWDAVANKPEDIAKEGTLSQGINEVKNAVANIDLSTVAKESTLLETRSLTNGKFGDVFVKFGELTTFIAQKFDWISNFIVTKKDELQQFISDRKLELHNLIAIDILGAINRNHGELLGKTNDVLGRQQAYENNAAARTQDTINVVNSQGSQLGKHLDDNKWALMGKVDEGVNTLSAKIDNIQLPEIDTTELAKQGENPNATLTAIYKLLIGSNEPSQDIPEGVAERLALILEFFGMKPIEAYEFMTAEEVCAELEEIMTSMDLDLTPEKAKEITQQTLNN
jgi:hypothetical protein